MIYTPLKDPAGRVYVHRWVLFRCRWFWVYWHKIVRGDDNEDGFHDHPWSYLTLIVRGGYLERRQMNGRVDVRRLTAGCFARRTYRDRHRFRLLSCPTYSLFIVGRARQRSQFYTSAGPVPWHEYFTRLAVEERS